MTSRDVTTAAYTEGHTPTPPPSFSIEQAFIQMPPPPPSSPKRKQLFNRPPPPQVKVIRQEGYSYRDPVTEFIECLYVNFDFDGAQSKLAECEKVQEGGVDPIITMSYCLFLFDPTKLATVLEQYNIWCRKFRAKVIA